MKRLILVFITLMGLITMASDDSRDAGRQNCRGNLIPMRATSEIKPPQGDLLGYESVDILVKNTGEEPVEGATVGVIGASPIMVRLDPTDDEAPSLSFQGWIPTPLPGGAKTVVTLRVPLDSVPNCAIVNFAFGDSETCRRSNGDSCRGKDQEGIQVHRKGAALCLEATANPKPIPTP